ncbi:hypothetical protein QWZ10_01205 [Paracoccus cavernae]|uniref:Uncharacterized protein n=1 Tax=Paracoccus cavernae TaxID=1571207 RepID=A0ABT8D2F1_9RHOB|nr:hypothetical protein [Paracoccus cavernae]
MRPSAGDPAWGGPGTVLNVGMNDRVHDRLAQELGRNAADALYRGFVQSYAIHVARLDPDMFSDGDADLKSVLAAYQAETDDVFPQDPARQLGEVLRSMARTWDGPTARLLRQAKGAPPIAPLGLVVQDMAHALGPGVTGSGTIQFVDSATGNPGIAGRFQGQTQGNAKGEGRDALPYPRSARPLARRCRPRGLCRSRAFRRRRARASARGNADRIRPLGPQDRDHRRHPRQPQFARRAAHRGGSGA